MADEQRIAVLETHIRTLYEQLATIRDELAALRGVPSVSPPSMQTPATPPIAESPPSARGAPKPAAAPPSSPPRAPKAAPRAPEIDVEELAGR